MKLDGNATGTNSKVIYLKSFGCSSNLSDGEVIAGCLTSAGYRLVNNPDAAEFLIYNTCAVKSPTENRMMNILKRVPPQKKLIVAGCLPLINFKRLEKAVKFHGVIGPSPGLAIVELIRKVERGDEARFLKGNSKPDLSLPRVNTSPIVRIIPIAYGCTNTCSYCCVRFARGKLRSYSIDEIVQKVEAVTGRGGLEIWFTGQDIAYYGRDIGTNLTTLLSRIIGINQHFLIRLGMMNPRGIPDLLPKVTAVYRHEKIFKFLHVPVQSGDDEVLKHMRRGYSIADFKKVVSTFRQVAPKLTLATDIICGFPTEDEEAFERTLRLVEVTRPDIVNISKFAPRPGTPAVRMKQIPSKEIKARSVRLAALTRRVSLENNRGWISWSGKILIDEKGYGDSWIGRNFVYKPVVVRSHQNLLGSCLEVEIIDGFPTYLKAKILHIYQTM